MKMLVAGDWVDKEEKIEVLNPYNGSVVDTVPRGEGSDVARAVEGAVEGLKEMKSLTSYERYEILKRTSELLTDYKERFAQTLTQEVGKTITEARREVDRTVQTFLWASEEAKRIYGETVPFDAAPGAETKMGFFIRVPVGVIGAITPFNFPLNLVAHKLAPAFAAANAVVLKPAEQTPLSAIQLGELLLLSGLPRQAIQIVTGFGEEAGDPLVADPRVRMITFTGSMETGKKITSRAGLKKMALELGSNSACIVMRDGDLERAAERISRGGFSLAGQTCISVQRVFVQEEVFDKFLQSLIPKVKNLKVGDPAEESTDVGPMIDEEAAKRAKDWVDLALEEGAKLLLGGEQEETLFHPTLLTEVPKNCNLFSKEVFAPVVMINRFKTLEEAIDLVNDSPYGLQAGIFTRDLKGAFEAARKIEVGGVMINEIPTFRADHMPYGGVKGSGFGREGPRFAVAEMTEIRLISFELS
ncbi:aldehyde dehydrogenase family protein [candidate division TA06 bacterium]|nr:aldehyde dehydrogenase family protein [candidate division TA06 bacterium]